MIGQSAGVFGWSKSMTKRSVLLIVALCVAGCLLLLLLPRGGRGSEEAAPIAPEHTRARLGSESGPEKGAALLLPTEAAARALQPLENTREREARSRVPLEGGGPSVLESARVRGSFLLPNGEAAAGVSVTLREIGPRGPGAVRNASTGMSGESGRFELELVPRMGSTHLLVAELFGHVPMTLRLAELERGVVVDVGTLTLERSGTASVRFVDAAGEPLGVPWMAYTSVARGGELEPVWSSAKGEAWNASVLLEGLPAGMVNIRASPDLAREHVSSDVEIHAGALAQATLVWSGPDLTRRIVVWVTGEGFDSQGIEMREAWLLGADMTSARGRKVAKGRIEFDDVPPGRYRVELVDERFEPWSKEGVMPGTSVSAVVRGAARLRLRVLDRTSGQEVQHFSARIRMDAGTFFQNDLRLVGTNLESPSDGTWSVPADRCTLFVGGTGYLDSTGMLEPAPGQLLELTVHLERGCIVRGRVLQADGAPAPRARVELAHPGEDVPTEELGYVGTDPGEPSAPEPVVTWTDRSGRFELAPVPAGSWTLHAIGAGGGSRARVELALAAGVDEDVVLTLEP